MSDDLDDLLRRSMKTLDDQVPSGYFEALPTQVQGALARLEDSSMATTGTSGNDRDPSTGVPPQAAAREEDSGLHDIRSLASSTKARLSSRRSTQSPIVTDDDVLASSSAGWKAVALPEPAKMVSLPALAELPSKREIEKKDKAARKAREAKEAEDAALANAAIAAKGKLDTKAGPAAELPSVPTIGARIAAKPSGGKGKTIALVGMGLAAAAGAVIYFQINSNKTVDSSTKVATTPSAPLPEMKAKMMAPPPPPPAQIAAPAVPEETKPAEPVAAAEPEPTKAPAKAAATEPKQKTHKVEIRDTPKAAKPEVAKPAPKDDTKKMVKNPDDGDPSFDALLKEAGVSGEKKVAKQALDKKSLSGADIKAGMGAVTGKAQACFAGTQGTAAVKLTVAPSGQVSKVTVTGVFAGTPVAACVTQAVKSASFPAWDGGPQSFGYSFLLSE